MDDLRSLVGVDTRPLRLPQFIVKRDPEAVARERLRHELDETVRFAGRTFYGSDDRIPSVVYDGFLLDHISWAFRLVPAEKDALVQAFILDANKPQNLESKIDRICVFLEKMPRVWSMFDAREPWVRTPELDRPDQLQIAGDGILEVQVRRREAFQEANGNLKFLQCVPA